MTQILRRLTVLLAVTALFAAACGSSDGAAPATEEALAPETSEPADPGASSSGEGGDDDAPAMSDDPVDPLYVGLVTDVGKVDDKSFNQSAWEGVQRGVAQIEGGRANYIETEAAKDYETNLDLLLDDGVHVIVTVGFGLSQATIAAAQANPDVLFIGVDQFQEEPLQNLYGLIFPEDQSGFLAGALAGMITETNIVGAVLGTDLVPPVVAFKEGWENGARYTNPDVETISTYHPGGIDTAFGDPDWGAATARQAIDQDADVIFGAGGATGNGALIEIAAESGVYCVGVDTDQWNTVPEARPCLLTSAMKLITDGVSQLIGLAYANDWQGGNFVGDVGLAPFHDFESVVTDEMRAALDEIRGGLADGSIPTGYPPS